MPTSEVKDANEKKLKAFYKRFNPEKLDEKGGQFERCISASLLLSLELIKIVLRPVLVLYGLVTHETPKPTPSNGHMDPEQNALDAF